MELNSKIRSVNAEIIDQEDDQGLLFGWYIEEAGRKSGPVSWQFLQSMIFEKMSHASRRSTSVWHPNFSRWHKIEELREFAESIMPPNGSVDSSESQMQGPASSSTGYSIPSDTWPLVVLVLSFGFFIYWFTQMNLGSVSSGSSSLSRREGELTLAALSEIQLSRENVNLELCNLSQQNTIHVAVAYFDSVARGWKTRGWYTLPKGECRRPELKIKAPVYVYGENSDQGRRWTGGDSSQFFCVRSKDAFELSLRDCGTGAAEGIRWEGFYPLKPDPATGKYIWSARN